MSSNPAKDVVEVVTRAIGPGALLSVSRQRTVDQLVVVRPKRIVVDPEPLDHTGPELFEHDIGGFDQLIEGLGSLVRLEIERDTLLAPVDHLENGTDIPFRTRFAVPSVVASTGIFDFDYFGTGVRE